MSGESWLPWPGNEDYWVSDLGNVYSTLRKDRLGRRSGGRMLTLTPRNKLGYLCVGIAGELKAVHQLVLETFVGPAPGGMICRHLNDVPTDNRLTNLAWGSYQDNADDRVRNGSYQKKTHCLRGHLYDEENTWLTREGYQQCRACHRERAKNEAGRAVRRAGGTHSDLWMRQ